MDRSLLAHVGFSVGLLGTVIIAADYKHGIGISALQLQSDW
jgi:hypothetical protein